LRSPDSDVVVHRLGTFRSASPAKSLLAAREAAKICGVSRLAGVTGLDHIGVPVWAAIRPMGRSLSVSQGKGLTDTLAQVSALMEAIELFHAESLLPTGIKRSIKRTTRDSSFVGIEALPICSKARIKFDSPIRWIEAHSLVSGKWKWIPRELIDLDSTQTQEGFFVGSSNGLASGNSRTEAIFHGITEMVERDQTAHWEVVENLSKSGSRRRLDLTRGLPAAVERIVGMIKNAGLEAAVWHTSITVEVPCFACTIADMRGNTLYPQRAAGYGCHVSKEIAVLRALTEAAQSRLTFISGARDDLFLKKYENDISVDARVNPKWSESMKTPAKTIRYDDLPDFSGFDTFSAAVKFIVSCVLKDGMTDVFALDLTNEQVGIPVVHVSAPFAEFDASSGVCDPGLRLCRFLKAQKQS
jgi:YcaO-like protein with predicted kinase domain